jgi:hypothetical protein
LGFVCLLCVRACFLFKLNGPFARARARSVGDNGFIIFDVFLVFLALRVRATTRGCRTPKNSRCRHKLDKRRPDFPFFPCYSVIAWSLPTSSREHSSY